MYDRTLYSFAKKISQGENEIAALIASYNTDLVELVKQYQTGENLLSAAKAYVNFVDCFIKAERSWPEQLGPLYIQTSAKAGLCLPLRAWCSYTDKNERRKQDYTGVPVYILTEEQYSAARMLKFKPQVVTVNGEKKLALVGNEALEYAKLVGESLDIRPT